MKQLRPHTIVRLRLARAFRWLALAVALLVSIAVFAGLNADPLDELSGAFWPIVWLLALLAAAVALLMDHLDH